MKKEKTSIIFSGDIGFDRYMDGKWKDENLLSAPVLDFFRSADHICLNVEGALYESEDDGSHGAFYHTMNPGAIDFFNKVGADIWSIGNNHVTDAGVDGIISTREFAKKNGVKTMGAGLNEVEASEPVYIDEAGGIGMLCVTYMNECCPATKTEPGIFRWDDLDYIKRRIEEVKSKCRWCVVVCHGGEEFTAMPTPYTRERYKAYLQMGADAVVAHHPHVPENYELFEDGKAIFYSLGNFIFDTDYQRAHLYTDVGILLKLIFTEEKMEFEAIGTKINRGDERIDIVPLPDIFTNIDAKEYEILTPLAAKSFIKEEKRRMIFLEPERFETATQEEWNRYFLSEEPEGFAKGAHMDFSQVVPEAIKAESDDWKKSQLEKVKNYILRLVDEV